MGEERSKVELSVVIPVFNEENNLEELYNRLSRVLKSISERYQIIFVDDGSWDNSFEKLKEIQKRDKNVIVIQLARNFGQHPAISAGLRQAKGEVVIVMDADLQNPPEEIPKLLEEIKKGYDLVFGVRKKRKDKLIRKIGSYLAQRILNKLLGEGAGISAFLAVKHQFVEAYNRCPERDKFFTALFIWLGAKSTNVEVEHAPRKSGETKYSLIKLFRLLLHMIISFSEYPLRLTSWFGFLVSLLGLGLALKIVIQKLFFQINVPGYASIFAAIVFFGGVQMLFLGIIGEYLARVYIEARRRPDYIIRDILKSENKQ